MIRDKTAKELAVWIDGLNRVLIERGYGGDEAPYHYLKLDLNDFTAELTNAARFSRMEKIFVW